MNDTPKPAPETNGLGLAGFIVSLVGLCSGGLLSPIGLILSLIALGRCPRGFAIAGVVIGALGSCGILISLLVLPFVLVGMLAAGGALYAIEAFVSEEKFAAWELAIVASDIEQYEETNGALPSSLDDLGEPGYEGARDDPWDQPYVFEAAPDTPEGFRVFSIGPDGLPGTPDDIVPDADVLDFFRQIRVGPDGSGSGPGTP